MNSKTIEKQSNVSNIDILKSLNEHKSDVFKWRKEHNKEHEIIQDESDRKFFNLNETLKQAMVKFDFVLKEKETYESITKRISAVESKLILYSDKLDEIKNSQFENNPKLKIVFEYIEAEILRKSEDLEEFKKNELEKYKNRFKVIGKRFLSYVPLIVLLITCIITINSKINTSLDNGLKQLDKRFEIYELYMKDVKNDFKEEIKEKKKSIRNKMK